MTIQAFLPAFVAIVGLVVYVLAGNAKAAELGRLAFFAGLFIQVWLFAGHVVRF